MESSRTDTQVPDKGQPIKIEPTDLVLWSDESLLVVNKPAGLLTIAGGYQREPHLKEILEPAFGRLWTVHRLDRETSGVLVLARSAEVHRALNTQFQDHTTIKVYHALVHGTPDWSEYAIDLPLQPNGDRKHRTVVPREASAARAKPARTECRVLERFGGCTLLQAIPRTGRTHQIRAHLAHLGLPLVGDELYSGRLAKDDPRNARLATLIARTALHALRLTIRHPLTQESTFFEAPYPEDFAAALHQLKKGSIGALLRSE